MGSWTRGQVEQRGDGEGGSRVWPLTRRNSFRGGSKTLQKELREAQENPRMGGGHYGPQDSYSGGKGLLIRRSSLETFIGSRDRRISTSQDKGQCALQSSNLRRNRTASTLC